MYTDHFGLREPPFSLTPDPRYVFMSMRHREALAHLVYGIGQEGGFVQLTGDVGTGKTTMSRCLLGQLPPEVDVALIINPRLTSEELLAAVCDELRVRYPAGPITVKALVDALHRYLLDAHGRGRRTVLIIDEAQNLSPQVLEQVRLLTNLETSTEKLLQIVLIGQPELVELLGRRELRQVAQRVTARYHLEPFTLYETVAYIQHRLMVAGRTQPLFTGAAIRAVHRRAGGVPRLVNIICDRALLGAYAGDRPQVDTAVVRRAAGEIRGRRHVGAAPAWRWALVAGLVLMASGGILAAATGVVRWPRAAALGRHDSATPPGTARDAGAQAAGARTGTAPLIAAAAVGVSAVTLAEILGDPSVPGDRETAFASLYARWGVEYPRTGAPCEHGQITGFRCLTRAGTWARLRRLNLPAVIELVTADGRRYAAVTGLGDDTAMLELGKRQVTVPVSEIDAYWDGGFVVLWRSPFPAGHQIPPGHRGMDVEWIRGRLGALAGAAITGRDPQLYDAELAQRVRDFQRSRRLVPDGIAGDETLLHLIMAADGSATPTLVPAGP